MRSRLLLRLLAAPLLACLLIGLPTLAAAQVASFSVNPITVTAGSVATGTVTLTAPAPSGGTTVTLTSSDGYAAGVPGSVLVAQGATTANFPVATSYVSSNVTVTLTANYVHAYTTTLTVAFGPVLTLGPTDDSYVNTGSYASTNFGSSSQLLVKKDQNGITSSGNRCTYLKFDLKQVPAVPAILAATLRLNSEYNANGGPMTVKCYQVSDTTWTEGAITFNNAPGISSTFSSTGTYLTSQVMYITQGAVAFDLTQFVQAHIGQVVTLQLISEDITGQSALFYSKEAVGGGPMLTLSLQPGVASVSVAGPIPGGNIATTGIVSLTVGLTSSNPSAATVPASVVVPSGQTSASFTATSAMTVSTTTSTTITAK